MSRFLLPGPNLGCHIFVGASQDMKADDEKAVRRMKEARGCLKDHDAHARYAIHDKKK